MLGVSAAFKMCIRVLTVLLCALFCAQRFSFSYASPHPPTSHQKVIPVGPAEGMNMFITRN